MLNMKSLYEIGQKCKKHRVINGYLQSDVARDTGYSSENVSSFENGRNDNARILLWYLEHGLSITQILSRG